MQNVLIRSDSSSQIGLGHLMRDLVLAKQFKNTHISFATQDLKGNANQLILEHGFELQILNSNNKDELTQLIQKLNIHLLIIDNYEINYTTEKYIKTKTSAKIMVLDDTYEQHHCDILLNHNISANPLKYKGLVPDNCELRCGKEHRLLRDEFYREKKQKYRKNFKKTIFISMGGVDTQNLNIRILKVLNTIKGLEVNLVTTSSNKHLNLLKRFVKAKRWIHLHVNSKNIASLIKQSDIAIITPSVSANEVHFMQTQFIAIKTAQNQDDMFKYLKNYKYPTVEKFSENKIKVSLLKMIKHA